MSELKRRPDIKNKVDEHTAVNPTSLYGASKYYCEKMLAVFCKNNNIIFHNLRIGHVYGIGEEKHQKLLPQIILPRKLILLKSLSPVNFIQ